MTYLLFLCAFSMAAGFVDAVVGGGGLIQLPAALILLPGVPFPTLLGTNKFASFFGTSMAVQRYCRHVTMNWGAVAPAAVAAFVFAFLGSRAVTLLDPAILRPLVLPFIITDRDKHRQTERGFAELRQQRGIIERGIYILIEQRAAHTERTEFPRAGIDRRERNVYGRA